MMCSKLFSLFVFCFGLGLVSSQDIIGCGGFVQSSVPIKFEKIEVKLYTKQGSFKSKTECAPNNGYFLVAVYDKGDYILRIDPPDGWGFAPQEISLQIDGKSDPCSKGEDLNFKFTGFTINGKVSCLGRDQGPSGVTVHLLNKEGTEVTSNTTDEIGKYTFENVMPDDYTVKATHPTWVFKHDEAKISVTNDNAEADKKIEVAGYEVKGHVLSGGEPIQGVSFILFSNDVTKESITDCAPVPNDVLSKVPNKQDNNGSPLCVSLSQKDGSFVFPTIPSGNYDLVPFYTAQNIVFDIVPSKLTFAVNYKSVVLKTPFQVYGFSVQGKIIDTQGKGISNVVLKAVGDSGEERKSVSGIDGKYLLENVTTGHYNFKMEKDNFYFDDEKIHITPNTPNLKDIVVKEYSLCGKIEVTQVPVGVLQVNQHKVLLQTDGVQNTNIKTVKPYTDGKFCFQAPPGKYLIEVPLSDSEKKQGFLLKPSQLTVEITNSPILNVKFEQFRAVVKGTVKCIENCLDISIYMTPSEHPSAEKVFAVVEGTGSEVQFTFQNVLPGKYKVSPLRKKWCWNPTNVTVDVKDVDISNINFTHSGYYLKCLISHNITLNFTLENSKEVVGSFELKKGSNQFCLKTPGIYSLTPRSCYRFEEETYSYNTAEPKGLTLAVESYKVDMVVKSSKKVSDLQLSVRSLSSNKEEIINPVLAESEDNLQYQYEALHWGRLLEEFSITPVSKEVLFYPGSTIIYVKENCPGANVEFEGREGIFVEGQISPPFASVMVTITTVATEKHETKIIEVLTDGQGKYRVGPLHSDIQYDVTAVKDGYHITPQHEKKGSFIAQKLGHITVMVSDENDVTMSSVLLSLSGGQYRNNNLTQSDGSFTFSNLGPGQYFLRPMQKEYSFDPNSKMIDVSEGEDVVIHIKGKRVAFSCSGSLSSLTGIPEGSVAIEAVGLHKCSELHEGSISDQNGNYRLRGLQPGCSYNIRLVQSEENEQIERLAPVNQVIHIQQKDITRVNFIVFMKPTKFYLTAQIDTELDYLPSLKILLFDEDNMDSPIHTINPGVVKYIQFPPLKPKTYVVKLQTNLSPKTHETRSTSASVTPDKDLTKKHVKLRFEAKERKIDLEPTQSVITLPLAVAFVFLAYNYDSVLAFVLKVNLFIQNFNKAEGADTDSDQDDESAKSSKKKKR